MPGLSRGPVTLLAFLPFFSTALGGWAALRLRHRLHPVMALAAGVLVATALVDLLPEGIALLGGDAFRAGIATVTGYLLFSAVEAFVHREAYEHQHPPGADPAEPHLHPEATIRPRSAVGLIGPIGLIVHSTLDGIAIGLAFQAGGQIGIIVTLAVLTHDFADGLNVVTLVLSGGGSRAWAIGLLVLDAVAPVAGYLLSGRIAVAPEQLGLLLSMFAGVFLAIGAGHLLPEAQHRRPGQAASLMVLAVVGAVLVVGIRSVLP